MVQEREQGHGTRPADGEAVGPAPPHAAPGASPGPGWWLLSAVSSAWLLVLWEVFLLAVYRAPGSSPRPAAHVLAALLLTGAGLWTLPALLLGGLEGLLLGQRSRRLARRLRAGHFLGRAGWLAGASHRLQPAWRLALAGLLAGAACGLHLLVVALAPGLPGSPVASGLAGGGLLLLWQATLTLVRPARPSGRTPLAGRLLAWTVLLLIPLAALLLLQREPALRRPLLHDTVLAQSPCSLLQAASDLDGDGFPGLFGGDCAPGSAHIGPAAEDVPGNGVDEDCLGGDAEPRPAPSSRPARGTLRGKNVVLVTVGNLGMAQLGAGGSPRLITPALDLLVGRGILLGQAHAQSPSCAASLASLLKGRYPRQLRLSRVAVGPDAAVSTLTPGEPAPRYNATVEGAPVQDRSPGLARLLAARDYLTAAVVSAPELAPGTGLLDGFAEVDTTPLLEAGTSEAAVVGDRAVQAALGLLAETRGRSFLLWVHLPDPEPPYLLHGGTPYYGDRPEDRYHGEVAFTDAQVGRLLGSLDQQGLLASTVVVLAADHGPAPSHGRPGELSAAVLRVPLIFLLPGAEPRTLPARVENVDVVPTLLDLLGVPIPPEVAGQSLVPLLLGQAAQRPRPEVVAESVSAGRALRLLLSGDHELRVDGRLGVASLLRLRPDASEALDVTAAEPALLAGLMHRLAQWDGRGPPAAPSGAP